MYIYIYIHIICTYGTNACILACRSRGWQPAFFSQHHAKTDRGVRFYRRRLWRQHAPRYTHVSDKRRRDEYTTK